MKVCAYCDSYNDDNAKVCSSCGGAAFKQQCVNCGELFDGVTCPKCGVKVGEKPKRCPRCGKEYYTATCPDCGSTVSGETIQQQTGTTRRKAPLWLWILGWLFIFPVPLTILVLRSQRLGKLLKIIIIVAAWFAYFVIGFSSNTTTVTTGNTITTQSSTSTNSSDTLVLAEN